MFARAAEADAEDDPAEPFDVDGDGDIDEADRAVLKAAEQVEILDKSEAQKARESARAVTVVDTKQARERTADLGEVLSRAQGIQVRRAGGLGSSTRFSLNGLYDDQIRFFLDGVPLELAGWGLGLANIPVGLVQHIEVHRGVVPVALGADALGGAIDLVTDPSWVSRAAVSYQVGSFGTHRAIASARAKDDTTGMALGLSLFFDRADNDYWIDVETPDAQGRLQPARVRRFHDGYTAAGGSVELGIVDKGPVRRALLRLYATDSEKALQHNAVMTVPYGDVTYDEVARGATLDVQLEDGAWKGRLLVGGARRSIDFEDVGMYIYDWFGARVRERSDPGELGTEPIDQRVRETGWFARATAERAVTDSQQVRITVAPTLVLRSGSDYRDPNPQGRDPLSARRDLVQLVTGIEHDIRAMDDRLQNIGFVKHYAAWTDAEDVRPGFVFLPIEQRTRRLGVGDGLRFWLAPQLALKASYEWATRLPSVGEVFGNGVLIQPNLELVPERSHNANVGARFEHSGRRGGITAEGNLFARLADELIVLLGDDRFFRYQNVYAARILGVEGSAGWVAPREWASIEGSITVQDIRNASSEGPFAAFDGDRVPNRPWLLGSLGATVRTRDRWRSGDEIALFASSRYVREFFRGWESAGLREYKQVVPSQLVHNMGVTYALRGAAPIITTVEVQNLTDARVYDSFGAQRPGRAVFVKVSAEL